MGAEWCEICSTQVFLQGFFLFRPIFVGQFREKRLNVFLQLLEGEVPQNVPGEGKHVYSRKFRVHRRSVDVIDRFASAK